MQKTWQLKNTNPKEQKILSDALGISWITAQTLINRGVTDPIEAKSFLNPKLSQLPSPFLLSDMDKATQRILQAIAQKETIAIYGDYDVDGIVSTTLLKLFFEEVGISPLTYIPDRLKEGYGVNEKALENLKSKGAGLIITVDCGSKSYDPLSKGKELGLDIIVTDHHELDSKFPPVSAFVNPQRDSVGKELAGVGVAFFLILALRQKMRESGLFPNGEPNLKNHLDLVALATIADMVPLTGINRILVSVGLEVLSQTKKIGLKALKEVVGLNHLHSLTTEEVAFRLAPRINAGGRLSKASLGLELICETKPERAVDLAKILDACNKERQSLQEKQLREAMKMAALKENQKSLVVASSGWHPGLVGLLASKLMEKFHKPSVVLSIEEGKAKGSARSIPGIHMVELLKKCGSLLEKFGGHEGAAGLTLPLENLELFEEKLEEVLEQMDATSLTPTIHVDCELSLKEIQTPLLEEFHLLKPFGRGNPEPMLLSRSLTIKGSQILKEQHLKLKVKEEEMLFDAIGFNLSGHHPFASNKVDMLFSPQWNYYQGNKSIQLKIKDLKCHP